MMFCHTYPPVFIPMTIQLVVNKIQEGARLDSLISNRVVNLSRNLVAELINSGRIRVNNHKKKPGYRLKCGDCITGELTAAPCESEIKGEKIALDILFEDFYLLVIDKKPGMVVHPGPGNATGTLVNALIAHDPGIRQVGEDPKRAGIVHRLDKDTSGLLVVAKTDHALRFLQKEFKQRRVHKRYLALVDGIMVEDRGRIDHPVGRHPVKRKQMAVNYDTGKQAISLWTVVKRFAAATLVDVALETGRTHQIRVHFYAVNHPLVGDTVYQFRRNRKKRNMAGRLMLHSYRLSFRHPFSGKRLKFEVEPPGDFSDALRRFERSRP